jgi:AbrB family looped-hinge helix DNA binding protein
LPCPVLDNLGKSVILKIGMSDKEITRVGSRGTVVIPAPLRRQYGLRTGTLIIAEPRDDGILLRPAVAVPVETYTPERRAEFLLSTAIDEEDYVGVVEEVRKMGLDPETIPHRKPHNHT